MLRGFLAAGDALRDFVGRDRGVYDRPIDALQKADLKQAGFGKVAINHQLGRIGNAILPPAEEVCCAARGRQEQGHD